ncbi:MATE family efflux transporter [Blautia schinkii]|nr:MATE family efflux transporter [Blautia schinkii]
MEHTISPAENPLGTAPVGSLLRKFAIPSIISMLVNALYNIVDQIFIGQGVGMLGNAATNVAFPMTTVTVAISLLLGIGGAANFNLALGRKETDKARNIAGTAFGTLLLLGITLSIIFRLFLKPIVLACGATDQTLAYSLDYVGITSLGFPFFMMVTGGNHLIRADGKPTYSMISMLSGALINTVLDPLFIFVFGWGIKGAAWATVIGQIFSAFMVFFYLPRYLSGTLKLRNLIPKFHCLTAIISLGSAACLNQLAITIIQILMNNTLRHYGAISEYGSEIPLAVVGIVMKVNMLFLSIVIGLSQGAQPIISFNYGAQKYSRVKEAYLKAAGAATIVAVIAMLCFQIFPRQIISLFGNGDKLYYKFAIEFFRIFLFCTFFNGLQPVTSNFFTSIGKASKGIFLSMTRQIIFLVPLILIFPLFMGIDGVMYAGPIADGAAGILAIVLVIREFKKISQFPETRA